MSFHLEGPWLSTTGKRKGKVKYRSAEHKRQAELLEREWQELKRRHAASQETKRRERGSAAKTISYTLSPPPGRSDTRHIPSLNGGVDTTGAFKAKDKVYTGDKIIGIGTLHKSNAVPIFNAEAAVDISKMRR